MLDRMLRDRIVCGIRSSALQKQLLTKKDLSVEDAETMALSAEAADKDANKMAADASAVLKIKAQSTSTKEVPVECGRCGSIKHNSNACRWSNARCYHCGRRGHLAVKCRNEESARPRTREGARGFRGRVLTVKEGETDEDIEDSMHIWTLKSTREVKVKPPIRRTFTWGGVDVSMLIDTGSPVCVVSRQLFEQHKNAWPSLRPSRTKLSCYLGKLPVFGELLLPVSYDNTTVECALVVLDCPGPSLCGRDLISLLSDAGSPVLSLSAKPLTAQPSTTTQVTADVFAEFPDVFSSDLGLIKGPPAHLQLKEGATPKFCREFILVTDHQPLLGLLRPDRPTPPLAAARIQRWALYLGGFRYKLQYSPGKQLLNSDALSRLPQETSEPTTEGEPPDYVLALACVQEGVVSAEELQALTAGDPVLSKVMQYTRDGWPSSSKALERSLLPFYDRRLELSLAHRLLYWGRRVVIPVNAQHRMLHMLHETHQGSSAMKSIARSAFWWPGMDHDIEQLSAGCTSCIQNRPMPVSAPPVNWPTCQENWSRVHLDFAGPIKGSMILVLVDAHSKWIEAVPMKQATTSSTITCLRSIFGRFGIPRTIVSDNGTQFTSQEFADFANNNNITHLRTAAFHPQSNGLAERAVRTVKDGLKKMNQGRLEDCLCRLLFNYRRTPLASGKSPSELLLGYQIRSRLDTCFPPLAAERSGTSDDWTLAPDTNVYVRNFGKGDKWKTGTVKSADGARMVTVETPEGLVRRHVDQVHTRKDPPATQGHRESERSSISKTPQQTPGAGPKANAETRETSPPQRQSSPQPLDAPERNREPTVATELRRSTRERRPVQRLQYY
ncbi:uncharacterized protein K02A2.6-like [Dermacentor silvarum]|nr:uncharacterized protein K02A2.6-like [Dermacentor silvarum]